jgi:uroporphyrinogen decarboxylase
MTSKERVRAALRKQPVDRVPIFMWFHPATNDRLASFLGVPPAAVGEVMGNDVRQVWIGNNYAMEGIVHQSDGETHADDWGITWVKEGPFNQILRSPLAKADASDIDAYQFPYNAIPDLVAHCETLRPFTAEWFIGCDISPCLFELLCRVRGMEQAIEDLALQPETAARFFERAAEFSIALGEAACGAFPLDWFWTGDDVAGQECLIMNPRQWRSIIKPQLARIAEVGIRHHLPVAYHCCGAMRDIIPDLVEIGIGILNPIQNNCTDMDPAILKREFGSALSFMGGVDTIAVLPKGSPEQVFAVTRSLIDVMTADGGGYVLAASHTVPPETPIDNIFAMYAAAGVTREEIFDRAADTRKRP